MAQTSDGSTHKDYDAAILLVSMPQTSACQPAKPEGVEFNQWWHEMTEQIRSGSIAVGIGKQYKQDLLCLIHDEIERLVELEDDWDCEGALAVDAASIKAAQTFIGMLIQQGSDDKTEWTLPSVNATVDGGVQLYWFTQSGQTALNFRLDRKDIEVQLKPRHAPGTCVFVSAADAMQLALQALHNA